MRKLLIAVLVLLPLNSFSEQWHILGTRPMGMGGAFVAMAQGPIAQYWNPAGLAQVSSQNVSGMEIPVDITLEMTGGIMDNTSQIGDLANQFSAIKTAQTGGKAIDANQVAAFTKTLVLLKDMNKSGTGALLETAAGIDFKFSKVSVSVNNFSTIGLNPYIDTTNIGLDSAVGINGVNFNGVTTDGSNFTTTEQTSAATTIKIAIDVIGYPKMAALFETLGTVSDAQSLANAIVSQAITSGLTDAQITEAASTISQYAADVAPIIQNASSGNAYAKNTSNLGIQGGNFTEVAFGYGKYFNFLPGLSIGGNLKAINGRIVDNTFQFMSETDTKDIFKNTMDNAKSSWKPALDLGALWEVNQKYPGLPMRPRVGLVVRNLNSPKFDGSVSGSYKLDRQVRLGLAISPLNFWHLAMDYDLSKNKTAVNGFYSRQLALGTEINIINRKAFNIPLRLGMSKNTAESSSKTTYTAGTGLNMLYMHFDVSAGISSDKTEIDGTKYPNKLEVAASFGLLF